MVITLITPRITLQKDDFLGSGVPYWPVELATFASVLREAGELVRVLDLFGSNPKRFCSFEDHYLQGNPIHEYLRSPAIEEAELFVVFAISYMSHTEIISIIEVLSGLKSKAKILVLENSQAVTAYSLQRVATPLFEAGAFGLICGEPHFNWSEIKAHILDRSMPVPGNLLLKKDCKPVRIISKGAKYPVPSWDLFPISNYWSLPYSHGPKTKTFLPILTSRGCPYPCDFCVVPETNDRRWRGNSPADVVEEIITLRDKFGISDFQIEDLNPTTNHSRFEAICELLVARKANIKFALVSGTKAETIHVDKVPLFAAAGCRYISISPESGSRNLMTAIGKPFDYEHAIRLVAACRKYGIRTQACFLVGHPEERYEDYLDTRSYLRRLVQSGLDEVAIFIVSSFAGSKLYNESKITISDRRALSSFTPKGRVGSQSLIRRRRHLIRLFFWEKLKRGPDLWMQGIRSILGAPQTKMENLPRRVAFVIWNRLLAR